MSLLITKQHPRHRPQWQSTAATIPPRQGRHSVDLNCRHDQRLFQWGLFRHRLASKLRLYLPVLPTIHISHQPTRRTRCCWTVEVGVSRHRPQRISGSKLQARSPRRRLSRHADQVDPMHFLLLYDVVVVMASMGPPLCSDGNNTKIQACQVSLDTFNGAAALQRRKLSRLQWGRNRKAIPSMGPPLCSDGNHSPRRNTACASFCLQWGRRFAATETRQCRVPCC